MEPQARLADNVSSFEEAEVEIYHGGMPEPEQIECIEEAEMEA